MTTGSFAFGGIDCINCFFSRSAEAEQRTDQWMAKQLEEDMDLNIDLDDDIASVKLLGKEAEGSDSSSSDEE